MKTFILVQWKETGIKDGYTSLKVFISHHPGFNYHTIDSYIGRRKVPYDDEKIILERLHLHSPLLTQKPRLQMDL